MSESSDLAEARDKAQEMKALLLPDDPLMVVAGRAEQAGINIKWEAEYFPTEEEEEWELYLIVEIPNGREKRSVLVYSDRAESFLASGFENTRFLGRYDAVQFTD